MFCWWYWILLCYLFVPQTMQFAAKDCAPEGFLEEHGVNLVHMGLRIIDNEWKAFIKYKGNMYTKSLNDAFGYTISTNESQIFVGAWMMKKYQVFHIQQDIDYYFSGRNFHLPTEGHTLEVAIDYRNPRTKFGFEAMTFYERFRITSDAPYDRLTCKYYSPLNLIYDFCETRCQLLGANDGEISYNDCIYDLLISDFTVVANYSSKIWKSFTSYGYNILQEKVSYAPRFDHTILRHWYMEFPQDKDDGYLELIPDNCYYVHGVAYQILREEWMNNSYSAYNSTTEPIPLPVYPLPTTTTPTTTITTTVPEWTPSREKTTKRKVAKVSIVAQIAPARLTPIANVEGPLSKKATLAIIILLLLVGMFITSLIQFSRNSKGQNRQTPEEMIFIKGGTVKPATSEMSE